MMTFQPMKRSGIAPARGGQPVPRNLHDVAQPMRRDTRRPRSVLAA